MIQHSRYVSPLRTDIEYNFYPKVRSLDDLDGFSVELFREFVDECHINTALREHDASGFHPATLRIL